MAKELKQKGLAVFNNLSITNAGAVTLKFKFRYDEILTSINLLQGLNNDITILAKCSGKKSVNLGLFKIGSINFDKDGNAVIPFKSLVDNVNLNDICSLIDEEYVQLMFRAVIELPDPDREEATKEWED